MTKKFLTPRFLFLLALLAVAEGCNQKVSISETSATTETPAAQVLPEETEMRTQEQPVPNSQEIPKKEEPAPLKEPTPPEATPAAPIPQQVKDAPTKKFAMNHQNGKPFKVFQGKNLGEKRVVLHGPYAEYYATGQLQKKGNYEYGKKNGEWQFWSMDGNMIKQGKYESDRQIGEWKKFREDGSVERIERYLNGVAHGTWEAYHNDGAKPQWRREYMHGARHGTWTSFYANGQKQLLETFFNDKRHGLSQSWDDQGTLTGQGEFKNGKRDGSFRSYADGQLVEEEKWAEGVRKF